MSTLKFRGVSNPLWTTTHGQISSQSSNSPTSDPLQPGNQYEFSDLEIGVHISTQTRKYLGLLRESNISKSSWNAFGVKGINRFMGSPRTEEEWVEEIAEKIDQRLDNFTATHPYRKALLNTIEEVYRLGGTAALNDVGEVVLEIIELGRHPKSGRIRGIARNVLVNDHDIEIPMTSDLLKGSL